MGLKSQQQAPVGRRMQGADRGFTLVELLVVIGTIALLISFLMPALTRARKSAQQVQCAANLKQIHLAVALYTNDFDNKYPHMVAGFSMASGSYSSGWPQRLIYKQYLGPAPMPAEPGSSGTWDQAFKHKMVRIFNCPVVLPNKTIDERTGHYAINPETYDSSNLNYYLKATQVKIPARYILLGENRNVPNSGNFGIDRPDIGQPSRFNRRHNDGGNYAYADGHVEWHSHTEWIKQMQAWSVTTWPYYAPNIRLPFKNSDR